MGKIGIFPAAGALGTSIYNHLLSIVDPPEVILISRYPKKTPSKYIEAGVTVRTADYNKPETLDDAFNDVSYLILISYPGLELGEREKMHKNAISAAINCGVSHIFYTSWAMGGDCEPKTASHCMQCHLGTEAVLSTLPHSNPSFSYTSVRVGVYSESYYLYTAFLDLSNPSDKVRIPHDGSGPGIAWAKTDELGEAIAKLTQRYWTSENAMIDEYKDKVVLLSGPKAFSLAESVDLIGKALGKDIGIEKVSVDDFCEDEVVKQCLAPYAPTEAPKKWSGTFKAIANSEAAVTSDRLGRLLGREPESYETTISRVVKEAQAS